MKSARRVVLPTDSLPQREGLTEVMGDAAGSSEVKEAPRIKSESGGMALHVEKHTHLHHKRTSRHKQAHVSSPTVTSQICPLVQLFKQRHFLSLVLHQ